VAEGSEELGREATEEGSKRRQRSDWFGQSLGADWVEVEPGIYRHRSPAAPEDPDPSLDEELMEGLPNAEQEAEAEAEPEPSPAAHSPQHRWFRR
jgi:hypothetical protein